MKNEFIEYLQSEGWKLIKKASVFHNLDFLRFDKDGPYQVFAKSDCIEVLKYNPKAPELNQPFFSMVNSFTGINALSLDQFISLTKVMGISNPKSNARVIGTLNVDKQMHVTAIAEQILKN